MSPDTKKFVDECKARIARAAEGPWVVTSFASIEGSVRCGDLCGTTIEIHDDPFRANAVFIAHARADLPEALLIIEEHAAEIERLRGVVAGASKYFGVNLEAISYAP